MKLRGDRVHVFAAAGHGRVEALEFLARHASVAVEELHRRLRYASVRPLLIFEFVERLGLLQMREVRDVPAASAKREQAVGHAKDGLVGSGVQGENAHDVLPEPELVAVTVINVHLRQARPQARGGESVIAARLEFRVALRGRGVLGQRHGVQAGVEVLEDHLRRLARGHRAGADAEVFEGSGQRITHFSCSEQHVLEFVARVGHEAATGEVWKDFREQQQRQERRGSHARLTDRQRDEHVPLKQFALTVQPLVQFTPRAPQQCQRRVIAVPSAVQLERLEATGAALHVQPQALTLRHDLAQDRLQSALENLELLIRLGQARR